MPMPLFQQYLVPFELTSVLLLGVLSYNALRLVAIGALGALA